jgi:hypothetical protein
MAFGSRMDRAAECGDLIAFVKLAGVPCATTRDGKFNQEDERFIR